MFTWMSVIDNDSIVNVTVCDEQCI